MQGARAVPAFAPDTLFLLQALQKWQLGFLVSLYLLGPEFAPTVHARSYFLVPCSFSVLLLEERCVQVQALQQRVSGPSLSQTNPNDNLHFTPGGKQWLSLLVRSESLL